MKYTVREWRDHGRNEWTSSFATFETRDEAKEHIDFWVNQGSESDYTNAGENFDAWLYVEDSFYYIHLYFDVIDSTTMQAVGNFEEASDARNAIRDYEQQDRAEGNYIPGRYHIDTEVIGG